MRQRLLKVVSIDVGFVLALVGYYFFHKVSTLSIPCLFNIITGMRCPGCGITRCLFAILRLDFVSAFHYNQLVFTLLPLAIFYCFFWQYLYVQNRLDKLPRRTINSISVVLVIVALAFGVLRNL